MGYHEGVEGGVGGKEGGKEGGREGGREGISITWFLLLREGGREGGREGLWMDVREIWWRRRAGGISPGHGGRSGR